MLAAVVALISIWAGALMSLRRAPMLALAAAVWTGFSFVTSNVPFPIGTLYAERLYYAATLGLCLLVAWLVRRAGPRSRRLVAGGAMLWAAVFGARTFVRCFDWRDNATLFLRDVETQPRSLMLLAQAAVVSGERGEAAKARAYLEQAIDVQPALARNYLTLARLLIERGELGQAEAMLERARTAEFIDPVHDMSLLHFESGLVYALTRRLAQARAAFERCLEVSPRNPQHRHRILAIGLDLFQEQDWWRTLEEGERLRPEDPSWQFFRGLLAFRRRQFAKAVEHWDASLFRVSPSYGLHVWQACLDYAQSLARIGRVTDAQSILRRLLASRNFTIASLRDQATEMLKLLAGR